MMIPPIDKHGSSPHIQPTLARSLEISEILHRIAAQNTTVAPMGLVEKAWMDVKHLIMKNMTPHCHPRLERGTRKSFVSGSQLSSSGFPHSRE